jgi:hypothetical protein
VPKSTTTINQTHNIPDQKEEHNEEQEEEHKEMGKD